MVCLLNNELFGCLFSQCKGKFMHCKWKFNPPTFKVSSPIDVEFLKLPESFQFVCPLPQNSKSRTTVLIQALLSEPCTCLKIVQKESEKLLTGCKISVAAPSSGPSAPCLKRYLNIHSIYMGGGIHLNKHSSKTEHKAVKKIIYHLPQGIPLKILSFIND